MEPTVLNRRGADSQVPRERPRGDHNEGDSVDRNQVAAQIAAIDSSLRTTILSRSRRRFPTLTEEDREDCFQEALITALRNSNTTSQAAIAKYVAMTAQSRMIDRIRSADSRLRQNQADEEWYTELADEGATLVERAEHGRGSAAADELLGHLGETTQAVLRLRFVDEMRPAHIQSMLGISAGSYDSHLRRGLSKLSGELKKREAGEYCREARSELTAALSADKLESPPEDVRKHLRLCADCREWAVMFYAEVKETAALKPAPLVLLPASGLGGGLFERFGEMLSSVKYEAATRIASIKTDAVTLVTGGADQSSVAIGKGVAIVAASVAVIGGGAAVTVQATREADTKQAQTSQPASAGFSDVGGAANTTFGVPTDTADRIAAQREKATKERAADKRADARAKARAKKRAEAKREAATAPAASDPVQQPVDQAPATQAPVDQAPAAPSEPDSAPQSGSGGGSSEPEPDAAIGLG